MPDCGLQFGSEKRGWKENKFLVFNDVYKHTAWNNTNENRVVLIIDIYSGFKGMTQQKAEVNVLAAIAYERINKYLHLLFEFFPKILI